MNQLDNIFARITLYELLQFSKATKYALNEALAINEVFITQVPSSILDEEQQSLQIFMPSTCIIFSFEDMQVLEKYDRPMYFTSYLGSTEINCILVNPGSALNIMPCRVM